MKKLSTCCFTGYRPNHLPYGLDETHPLCEKLKCVFLDEINSAVHKGYTCFLTGLAGGTETWFAEVVLFIKQIYDAVKLECVLWNETQYERLKNGGNKRCGEIIRRCDGIKILGDMELGKSLYERNRYLVDCSSMLMGACNGLPGISRYLVEYARGQGLDVVLIDPERPGGSGNDAELIYRAASPREER